MYANQAMPLLNANCSLGLDEICEKEGNTIILQAYICMILYNPCLMSKLLFYLQKIVLFLNTILVVLLVKTGQCNTYLHNVGVQLNQNKNDS